MFFEKVNNTGKILEIGCGPVEISNYLWIKGLDITGIDKSVNMIKEAIKNIKNIKFEVGDVFDLKYDNENIAGTVASYLIVNFELDDLEKAFKEMYRVLKKNGKLLFSFHLGNDEKFIVDDFFKKGNKIEFTFFKLETVLENLKESIFHRRRNNN